MPRPFLRAAGMMLALAAGSIALTAPVAHAADGPDSGVVEIPYGEPLDVRASPGWIIDCAAVGALEDIEVVCAPDALRLSAPYTPDAGEQILSVPQRAGAAAAEVRYRVRLAPPAAPEVGASVIGMPLPVGAQSLVPLALLEITCGLCEDARLEVEKVEPAIATVGIGPGHLAVRPTAAGAFAVTLALIDDAGQRVSTELQLFAAAPLAGAPRGRHVVADEPPAPDALADRQDVTVHCLAVDPALRCAPDGTLTVSGELTRPVQAALRILDAEGRQSLASVTVDPGARPGLIAPAWADAADLGIAVPLPPEEETEGPSVLAPFARILQEVPAS